MAVDIRFRLFALLIALCAILPVQHAQARRRFIPIPTGGVSGSSRSETIDMVKDLPDDARFLDVDGYQDLGLIHAFPETYKKHGWPSDNDIGMLVLYRGEGYRVLDDKALAALRAELGYDPVPAELAAKLKAVKLEEKWRVKLSAASNDNDREAVREQAVRAGEVAYFDSVVNKQKSSKAIAFVIIGSILTVLLAVGGVKAISGGKRKAPRTPYHDDEPLAALASVDMQSLDARLAQRKHELELAQSQSSSTPLSAAPPTPTMAARPAFGRRVA